MLRHITCCVKCADSEAWLRGDSAVVFLCVCNYIKIFFCSYLPKKAIKIIHNQLLLQVSFILQIVLSKVASRTQIVTVYWITSLMQGGICVSVKLYEYYIHGHFLTT